MLKNSHENVKSACKFLRSLVMLMCTRTILYRILPTKEMQFYLAGSGSWIDFWEVVSVLIINLLEIPLPIPYWFELDIIYYNLKSYFEFKT